MPRKGTSQVNITFPKDSESTKIIEELGKKYAHLGIKPATVSRTLLGQRLELLKSGFRYDDVDTLHLLSLCISNKNPPSSQTLRKLRDLARSRGAEEGHEDEWLKQHNAATDLLRIGLSLATAGLEINDDKTVGDLAEIVRAPPLLEIVRILEKCGPEALKIVADGIPALVQKAG